MHKGDSMGRKLMLLVSFMCLVITSSPDAASNVLDSPGLYEAFSRQDVVSGFIDQARRKRGLVIGNAVLSGLRAVKTLLRGSTRVPAHKKNFKYARYADAYEKPGDYKRTMEDFVSVDPSDVKVYGLPKGNVLTVGQVGDRTICVKKFGFFGKPTLKILQKVGRQIQTQRIIYTDDIEKL